MAALAVDREFVYIELGNLFLAVTITITIIITRVRGAKLVKKSLKSRPAYASKRRSNLAGSACQYSPKSTPHENMKSNGIWTQRATFSTKVGVPLGLFLRFLGKISLNHKPRFGAKKGPLRADSPRVDIDLSFAQFSSTQLNSA